MVNKFSFYFIGLILFGIEIIAISCVGKTASDGDNYKNTYEIKSSLDQRAYFNIQDISIEKENNQHLFLGASEWGNDIYFHFYNSDLHRIDSYNAISGEGFNNLYSVTDLLDIASCKFAFYDHALYCLDNNAVLWKHIDAEVFKVFDFSKELSKHKLAIDYARIGFDFSISNDSTILVPLHIDPASSGWVKPFGYPMSAVLNLKNLKLSLTGILYPKHYHKYDYGLLRSINQIMVGNRIVYNPHVKDEIWEYDMANDSIIRHPFRSSYQDKEILPLTFKSTPKTKDLLWKHADLSGEYINLIYDKTNHIYLRFFKHFRNEKKENGLFSTYKEDVISVIIADKDFGIIGEFVLPEKCYFLYFAHPSKHGVFLNNGPLFGENNAQINLLRLMH